MANVAQVNGEGSEQGVVFSPQKLHQLLAMIPRHISDEVESPFS